MPTCMTYTPSQGYHFKKWKAKQALYDCILLVEIMMISIMVYNHDLKKVCEPHIDISVTYLWSHDDAKAQATKTWFVVGIFPYDGTYKPP